MLKYMNTYSHEEGLFSNIRVGLRRLVNNNCIVLQTDILTFIL